MAVPLAYSTPAPFPASFPAAVLAGPPCPAELFDRAAALVRVDRDAVLFDQGAPAGALYRLVEGVVRLVKLLPDGRRQIVGFLQPGDVFGLPLGASHVHAAEAVTAATVRRVPRARLEALLESAPAVRRWLFEQTAAELATAHEQMLLLGRKTAQEKLCSFLAGLARRRAARGQDPRQLYVPMTRADIADHLGLTIETVSRTLTKLKTAGLIRLRQNNKIDLAQPDQIDALAEGA